MPARSIAAAALSGCYVAIKGQAYARSLHNVALSARNVVWGQQHLGLRVAKEHALEGGALGLPFVKLFECTSSR